MDNANRKFISRFSPNRSDPEHLEQIHVQRHELLNTVVDLLRESGLTQNKHHFLFVGPRGCGKTHLICLIVHRLLKMEELKDKLRIAWLVEDETSTTFLELLIRIYGALEKRYPTEFPASDLESFYGRTADQALHGISDRLIDYLSGRTVLVLIENLDHVFQYMKDGEQKRWRAFIQNNPVFTIVATAQRLISEVRDQDKPFHGFFDKRTLGSLSVDEARDLLSQVAKLNQNTALIKYLSTSEGRARMRAIHHLAGGNHRIYIVLSEFITSDSLDELVRPFENLVDEQLTPYYQERLRWLSSQQRKIVEYLCHVSKPIPVKDIANRLFATHSTIANQLKQLREMGYVRSYSRGRESLYELTEPLMRLSMQVKSTHQDQPLGLIVDFLRVWYEREELETRMAILGPEMPAHKYYLAAIEKFQSNAPHPRHALLRQEFENLDLQRCDEDQFNTLKHLAKETDDFKDWVRFGQACNYRKEYEQEIKAYSQAINDKNIPIPNFAIVLGMRGIIFDQLNRYEEAIADYTTLIKLEGIRKDLVAHVLISRGLAFARLNRYEEAIADYTILIELKEAPKDAIDRVFLYRGMVFSRLNRYEEAIADFTTLIELKEAPKDAIDKAFLYRGMVFGQLNRYDEAKADFLDIIKQTEIEPEIKRRARISLCSFEFILGEWDQGICMLRNTKGHIGEFRAQLVIVASAALAILFEQKSSPDVWRERINNLVETFEYLEEVQSLGDALVRHLDDVKTSLFETGRIGSIFRMLEIRSRLISQK